MNDSYAPELAVLERQLHHAFSRHLERTARRRRTIRTMSVIAVSLAATAGIASAAAQLLGNPAPPRVKDQFAAVNRGLPESLRLQVDAAGAVSVAATERSTLYLARITGGGYCLQMVTGHTPDGGGVTCTSDVRIGTLPIDVTAPHSDGAGPVTIGGRVNVSNAASVTLVYDDGSRASVPFGTDRFFIVDIPDERVASVREHGLAIAAADTAGSELTTTTIPADWDQSAEETPLAAIDLSTRSDEDDLTKVYGLTGRVTAAGATTLELVYTDGETVQIPLGEGGAFDYDMPANRRGDFMQPQRLVARNDPGEIVAETPVAAVASYRANE